MRNATSDGISRRDWDRVHALAARIANAALAPDSPARRALKPQMIELLENLQAKYGELPSILATRADYESVFWRKVALLERAFVLAEKADDCANMTFIAHSLAQLHVDKSHDAALGRKWTSTLGKCLRRYSEDYEAAEYAHLLRRLASVGKKATPIAEGQRATAGSSAVRHREVC